MRTRIHGLWILLFLVYFASGTVWGQTADEQEVRECALNYLEGWYSADTARMAKALSKDLAKKGFLVHPRTGELTIAPATYDQMLQWVGQKPDQLAENPDIKMEVHLIEVGEYIAMVKTVTPDFIDYLQLAKMEGQWKIYHAVWERPPEE
jgi:hypothetical protein